MALSLSWHTRLWTNRKYGWLLGVCSACPTRQKVADAGCSDPETLVSGVGCIMHIATFPRVRKHQPGILKSMPLDLDLAPCSSGVKVRLRQTPKCCPESARRQLDLRPVGPLICQRPPSSRLGRCSCLELPRPAKISQTPWLHHRPFQWHQGPALVGKTFWYVCTFCMYRSIFGFVKPCLGPGSRGPVDDFTGKIFLGRSSPPPVTSAPCFGTTGLSGATALSLKENKLFLNRQ